MKVSKRVVIEILNYAHTARRASVLTHFIHIAACCKAWDNYVICYCIISALNTNSHCQHDRLWEGLSHHYAETSKGPVSFIDPFHYFEEVTPIFEEMNPCGQNKLYTSVLVQTGAPYASSNNFRVHT
ncbi:hypothetical protein Pelo_11148 [Pelomyxa schiedti]|nr:hypothetical protein Pelo_11148 [Pelomyxa schiedti]